MDIALSAETALAARYAFARYRSPELERQDSHRLMLALTWRPGRSQAVLSPLDLPASPPEAPSILREREPHLFRWRAPGAARVALVGDFNAWNPEANPLSPLVDGWWETVLALAAGTYQYAFWIDGRLEIPPDAEAVIDDGFGGRNALLKVWPTDQ
jgi:hypothetical protein